MTTGIVSMDQAEGESVFSYDSQIITSMCKLIVQVSYASSTNQ